MYLNINNIIYDNRTMRIVSVKNPNMTDEIYNHSPLLPYILIYSTLFRKSIYLETNNFEKSLCGRNIIMSLKFLYLDKAGSVMWVLNIFKTKYYKQWWHTIE
jgi:hypothetical protein